MEPLVVPAELSSLSAIRTRVRTAASEASLGDKDTYRLALAVDEIATNIITHGYKEAGREGTLGLETILEDGQLTVVIEDNGVPFDPTTLPEPDVNQSIDERKLGGMGIYLAIRGVDKYDYQRKGNTNRNVFVIRREKN